MADKNLTNALFTLKDKESKKPSPVPPKQTRVETTVTKKRELPFRKRSFDTFFGFSITLLIVALAAQVIAIIAYS